MGEARSSLDLKLMILDRNQDIRWSVGSSLDLSVLALRGSIQVPRSFLVECSNNDQAGFLWVQALEHHNCSGSIFRLLWPCFSCKALLLVEEGLELREVGFDLREINACVQVPLIIFVPADSLLQVPHLLGHLAVDFDQARVQGFPFRCTVHLDCVLR